MKKICKVFILNSIIIAVMLIAFTVNCLARGSKDDYIYSDSTNEIVNSLESDAVSILNELGLEDYSPSDLNEISLKSVFNTFLRIFKGAYKVPFSFLCLLLGLIIINAVAGCYISKNGAMSEYFDTVSVLFAALLIMSKVIGCISDAVNSMYSLSIVMKMLIPVMAVMTSFSGSPAAAVSYNAITLYSAEIMSELCNGILTPVLCVFACVSVCCAVNNSVKIAPILEMIKKAVNVALGLFGTVFTGIIGIKDVLSSGIDKVSVKGIKFILGSAVPVVGGSLSEGLSSVIASISLMKNSYGVFAIIIAAVSVVPVIIEILLWLAVLSLSSYAASSLGQNGTAGILNSLKFVLSILLSMILFCVYIFIISTAMVMLLSGK